MVPRRHCSLCHQSISFYLQVSSLWYHSVSCRGAGCECAAVRFSFSCTTFACKLECVSAKCVCVCVCVCLSVCLSVGHPLSFSNSSSSLCSGSTECLQFDLVCKTEEYEVRHCSPSRWVSTDAEAYFMGVGAAMAFRRLYQYITGANQEGVQMDMATPVLVRVPEETQMWEPAIYTLNFLLPSVYQDNPPVPTNDKLYFTDMPEMDVYVRSYGGWMLSITSRLHAHLLTKELQRVNAYYNHTHHYAVGYDSPLKLLNRHNEVWYVVDNEPSFTRLTSILLIKPKTQYRIRCLNKYFK
uniref:Heme-binding protein 1 n=1 Tax=Electrophorus electricus TaxID=8005 RepID=A0A4W4FWI7_ELEEL